MDNHVIVSNVSKTYAGGTKALKKTNLTIPAGKVVGIIGENGSGKSTFLKILAGLINPDEGVVNFGSISPLKNRDSFSKTLGYLSQDVRLDPEMTIGETLELFAALYGINGKERKPIIRQLIEEYGLRDHLKKVVRALSGGLKQRLHIAISMINDPHVFLLDEPTNSLDTAGKLFFWKKLVRSKKEGRSVFIISHDLSEVEKNCDYLLIFHKGEIVLAGDIHKVLKQDNSHRLIFIISGPYDSEKIRTRLNDYKAIKRLEISKNQIIASIENDSDLEKEIETILKDEELVIIEKRRRSSDISTLYFNLTGSSEIRAKSRQAKNKRRLK